MKTRLLLWSLLLALPLTFSSCSSEEEALSLSEQIAADDAVDEIREIFTDMHNLLGSIAGQYSPGELEETARSVQTGISMEAGSNDFRLEDFRLVALLLQDLYNVNLRLEAKFPGYAAMSTNERRSLLTEVLEVPIEAMSEPGDGMYPLCDGMWWLLEIVRIGFNLYCSNPPPQDVGFCAFMPLFDWLFVLTGDVMYDFCASCLGGELGPCF